MGREGEFAMSQTTVSLSPNDLEVLVRRVVREELTRLLHVPVRSILEDWRQEGPDDPAEDELLLREALAVLQGYGDRPEAWMNWEDFEAELDRAEAAGELPGLSSPSCLGGESSSFSCKGTTWQAKHLPHLVGGTLACCL